MADSPTPCTPVDSDQGTSYGAFLGGILFAFMFYGANCLQIFVYLVKYVAFQKIYPTAVVDIITPILSYPNDRMTLKALDLQVAGVWAADTVHQILGTIGIWQYLVSNFGNYVFLEQIYVPALLSLVFSGIVSATAQLFLTRRIWYLSGRIWIFPAFLIPAVVAQLVITCIYMAEGLTNLNVQNLYDINGYATAANIIAAGTDIGFNKRTDAMLARVIIISVNSGLWTGIFALVALCMSPLYCNTILGCLNTRDFINNGIHRDHVSTFHLGTISISHAGGAQRPVSIAVETKQTIDTESLDDQTLQAPSALSRYRM
ncbi:hypothetical protein K503DRAFT_785217 [Rhizopogon vinicolor AM-OR11-026]|uniref:Uncharacterized protein n=1 Tax=Rhizopogon vinicolor AM-OR11-026 TaxID=1314800 RepID=A0A1B7MRI9_9AGAM|nr:hypothetical protein K503DRAFT_785217 [Rhizopogon vinicolor AM-OR11-026]